jgi:hypothetical protein
VREGTIVSFLQAQAAPAPPCDRSQRPHPRRPLADKLAEELERPPEDRDAFDASALDACLPELSADPSIDPDADPSAALLLRVEPASPELRLDRIGHNGQAGPTEGEAAHREGLLRLAATAQSVGEESHHNSLKAAALDSRPPAAPRISELRLNACSSASAPRAGDANDTEPLPVGRGATNPRGVN